VAVSAMTAFGNRSTTIFNTALNAINSAG